MHVFSGGQLCGSREYQKGMLMLELSLRRKIVRATSWEDVLFTGLVCGSSVSCHVGACSANSTGLNYAF